MSTPVLDRDPLTVADVPSPLDGLDDVFPDRLVVLKARDDRYVCFGLRAREPKIDGLACFTTPNRAVWLINTIPEPCEPVEVTFDEAREIAKDRAAPLTALLLLDDPDKPEVHWIR